VDVLAIPLIAGRARAAVALDPLAISIIRVREDFASRMPALVDSIGP